MPFTLNEFTALEEGLSLSDLVSPLKLDNVLNAVASL